MGSGSIDTRRCRSLSNPHAEPSAQLVGGIIKRRRRRSAQPPAPSPNPTTLLNRTFSSPSPQPPAPILLDPELGTGTGKWNLTCNSVPCSPVPSYWELELGSRIWEQELRAGTATGTGNLNRELELGTGTGNWNRELTTGTGNSELGTRNVNWYSTWNW